MRSRKFTWITIFILWLAFALRVWHLDTQSLWYDEGYSVYLGAHLPLDRAIDLTVRDIVPPLYYLLLRVWLPFAGTTEYALRFLSVLFGVTSVALAAQIGRDLMRRVAPSTGTSAGEWSGLLSAALFAVAPVFIWLSQDARMYGPLVTWTLLAAWGLLKALAPNATRRTRRWGWGLFVLAGLAALYTHTVSAFWLLGQGVFGILAVWHQREQQERVHEGLVALGAMAIGYLPWVIVVLFSYETNAGYWPGHLPPTYLWRTAWDAFVGGEYLPTAETDLAAAWFGVAALLAWVILLFKQPRVALYLFCFLIIPLAAMGVAFRQTPKLAARYPTALAPALFFALAAGSVIAVRVSKIAAAVVALVWVGLVLISARADANLYFSPEYGNANWRAAAQFVQTNQRSDEAVLLVSGHAYPVFSYYYGWQGWDALPQDDQLDVRNVLHYADVAPRLNQILANASGAWLVSWQDEVVDPTGIVPALLSDIGREVSALAFQGSSVGDDVEIRHFELSSAARFPEELPVDVALDQPVAPGLAVLGYSLPSAPLAADSETPIRVFWQAKQPLQGAFAGSLRLYDGLGQEWARQDALLAGPYFSGRWPVGNPVMGTFTATLPIGTPPGTYTPTLMVYRGDETFDTLHLNPLIITRPMTMSTAAAIGLPAPSERLGDGLSQIRQELSLLGVGFDSSTATPCQNWSLSLTWRAESVLSQDYGLRLSVGEDSVDLPMTADYPSSRWQAGDVWRTRHHVPISCRALDGTVPAKLQLLDASGSPIGEPLSLGEVAVVAGRQFSLPTDLTAELDVRLIQGSGEAGENPEVGVLVGYQLDQDRVQPGDNLEVTLYWQAGQETDRNYSVFTHLQGDRVWAQHDSWPMNGAKPTSTWANGEIIADHHSIAVGQDVPPGTYQLLVGMYDAETLEPLAAVDKAGNVMDAGRILLQSVNVYLP